MFEITTFADLIERAHYSQTTLGGVALDYESALAELAPADVLARMRESLSVMKQSRRASLSSGVKSVSGLSGGAGYKLYNHMRGGDGFVGGFLGSVLCGALSVAETNACMGKIVAAPTAGACGILPACLLALQEHHEIGDDALVMGLLNASAVGVVIAKNASISGAEGGCQAECGSAAAMAASAITEILGGTPEMCGHACAHALKSLMGLVCDPVAGLVEEPCIIRNASSAAIAVSSAEIALAGIHSIIPVDEVIAAMKRVGGMLPDALRETAKGGLAVTDTGTRINDQLFS